MSHLTLVATPLGLSPGTNPDEANDFIDTLQKCFDKLGGVEDFRKRIDGIDRDKKDLEHLLEQVATDLQDTEIIQAVSDLQARLNGARQDQAVFKQYLEEIETLEKEILQAKISLNSNNERMAALLEMAGCEKEEELDEAEQRSNERVLSGRSSRLITSLLAESPVAETIGDVGRGFYMEKRGDGVPIILNESKNLSGKTPVYQLIDDSELLLIIYAATFTDSS